MEFRHTPKHGSWLNIAENELSALTRQCVGRRRFGTIGELRAEAAAWSASANAKQRGVDWQFRIDEARIKLKSLDPKGSVRRCTRFAHSANFSSYGSQIVTGSSDGTAKAWEAKTGAGVLTLKGHTAGVLSVSFSADGSRIVTGSDHNTAKVWDSRPFNDTRLPDAELAPAPRTKK